jgi:sec-independent protein translocase protein TatB
MLNIGIGEMTLILIAALLIMGPDRLPEFARSLGKFMREFRRQTDDVRGVVMREIYKIEEEVDLEGKRPQAKTLPPPSPVNPVIAPPAVAAGHPVGATPVHSDAAVAESPAPANPAVAAPPAFDDPPVGATHVSPALGPDGPQESRGPSTGSGETAPTAQVAAAEPAPPEPEPNVTVVDGIRIAPATGTVARNAKPAPAPAATDAPPPPTSQS